MNSIVEKWQQHESTQKQDGPDSVQFDDETKILLIEEMNSMAERKPPKAVSVNKFALIDLALFGPQDRKEAVFRVMKSAASRLGVSTKDVEAFEKAPRGTGNWPNAHDVQRWVSSLQPDGDLNFFTRAFATFAGRVPRSVRRQKV